MRLTTSKIILALPIALLVAHPASAASLPGVHLVQRDLTAWQMFLNADWIVKSVMIVLVIASITTWAILFAKQQVLVRGRKQLTADIAALRKARSLSAVEKIQSRPATEMFEVAREEIREALDLRKPESAEAMKERLGLLLASVEANAQARILSGASVLASIGAVAPFVGLFGTVWGIMNSFIGINKAQTTNLAVVAPGIAEALLATAFGLVAAIPAVLIYNALSRSTGGYRRLLSDVATQVACLVSREVEHRQVNGHDGRIAAVKG